MAGHTRGHLPECWCCGRSGGHGGRGLCCRCYNRWRNHGFAGAGPGPEFTPARAKAADRSAIITSLSAAQAARRLGVTSRTVQRWRAALRENRLDAAGPTPGDYRELADSYGLDPWAAGAA